MKIRKSFAEHVRDQNDSAPVQENLLSKGYAISQNAQHNSTKQKISAIRSNVHSIVIHFKNEEDLNKKIDLLADIADQMMVAIERLSELSTNVKNVVVANALLSDDLKNRIKI
jgi:hypothetical protein